jgi:hypothetical protein
VKRIGTISLLATVTAVITTAFSSTITEVHKHHHKHRKPSSPMHTALASYYDLDGPGACGTGAQTGLHFASLIFRCGQRIRICHQGCVIATMADHGPYVSGRTFDLNVNLRNAIHCSDLCTVKYAIH